MVTLALPDELEARLAAIETIKDGKSELDRLEALRVWAKQARVELAQQNRVALAKLLVMRRTGDLLAGWARHQGARSDLTFHQPGEKYMEMLANEGIAWTTAKRWQELVAKSSDWLRDLESLCTGKDKELTEALTWKALNGNDLAVHFTSDTPEWYTPESVVARVVEAMGAIDLDPCADPDRQIPAARHFTVEDDGLGQVWSGRVYMNPPYGDEIMEWVRKLADEVLAGNVPEAIALVPARTDTTWWQLLRDCSICFVRGRLKFSGQSNSAPFPSVAAYFGSGTAAFIKSFADIGDIWKRVDE